eukprot:5638014-Lingulodinium_polyedra.AAC.1
MASAAGRPDSVKLPKTLSLGSASKCLPKASGCHLFESSSEGRLRCFYTLADGTRASTSSNIAAWGQSESLKWCIKWAWKQHAANTGAECPYSELMESWAQL